MKSIDMLKNFPLFASLDDEELTYLQKIAVKKYFPKNTVLFSKGDESDALYIMKSGKVKAIINDEEGKEIVLSVIGPNEYFGEVALLDGEPRSATIVTKEPTEVFIVYRNDFKKILLSNPDLVFNFLTELLKRLRKATDKIESLAFMDVYRRITDFLMQFAKPQGEGWVINEKWTHQEIANTVGASREMVSKILKELQVGGYISIDKKHITIHKQLPSSF